MQHSTITRILHGVLAVLVLNQLILSLVMDDDGHGIGGIAFEIHETTGLITAGFVALFWLWALARRGETPLGMLFPWFSPSRLRALAADVGTQLGALARLSLPERNGPSALASAVHGLGLLALTGAGTTGAIYFGFGGEDAGGWLGEAAEELHEGFGTLMWVYLAGHAGLAVLHALSGHDIVRRMFVGASRSEARTS